VAWQAEQYIDSDPSLFQVDYQVLARSPGPPRPAVDVLLVAASKERVDARADFLAQAGCPPAILDVEACAVVNTYRFNHPERTDPLTVLLHVGRDGTIACVLQRGRFAFAHEIQIDGVMWRRESSGEMCRRLAAEVRRGIDLHQHMSRAEGAARIVLSGDACDISGVADVLGAELSAPVETLDPFRRIARPAGGSAPQSGGPGFAVAVGLALRGGRGR
jgi:Tfp pilus assembly PilM family ATPase